MSLLKIISTDFSNLLFNSDIYPLPLPIDRYIEELLKSSPSKSDAKDVASQQDTNSSPLYLGQDFPPTPKSNLQTPAQSSLGLGKKESKETLDLSLNRAQGSPLDESPVTNPLFHGVKAIILQHFGIKISQNQDLSNTTTTDTFPSGTYTPPANPIFNRDWITKLWSNLTNTNVISEDLAEKNRQEAVKEILTDFSNRELTSSGHFHFGLYTGKWMANPFFFNKAHLEAPFPVFVNPSFNTKKSHKEMIRSWVQTIITDSAPPTPKEVLVLDKLMGKIMKTSFFELGLLTSPHLNEHGVKLMFNWLLFLFLYDDLVDNSNSEIGKSAENIQHLNTIIIEMLALKRHTPSNPIPSSFIDKALDKSSKSFHSESHLTLRALQSCLNTEKVEWQQSFFQSVANFIQANHFENINCRLNPDFTPDLNTFLNQRLHFGGGYTVFHLWACATSLTEDPNSAVNFDDIFNNNSTHCSDLKRLAMLANISLVLSNDIFSAVKEELDQSIGLVSYIKDKLKSENKDIDSFEIRIYEVLVKIHNQAIQEFVHLKEKIKDTLSPNESKILEAYESWVTGNFIWSALSGRYLPKNRPSHH